MCGTPVALSRTIVTSGRGLAVLATWSAGTPKDASLKKLRNPASVSPGYPEARAAYGPSWSSVCAGRLPNIRFSRISASVALPFSPGGRMSVQRPPQ